MEFDETLIEVETEDGLILHNTFDADYFFNASSLAREITENRLLAAVPGFLTAIGVVGTFVGLQLGLSELNIGNNADVSEMKAGIAHVISGAKIAFMTSVWGVFLSVVFNFFEKFLESGVRRRIHKLQTRIDKIFPRLSAEYQLQRIANDGQQSRESLQGLAERIGEKMQESLYEVRDGIKEGLIESLEKIMAPAINKLVDETTNGNQHALDSLIENFISKFGELGSEQRNAMDLASQNVSDALGSLDTSMSTFLEKLEVSQGDSANREKELVETIATQVAQIESHSIEQSKLLTGFVEDQLGRLSKNFDERDIIAARRDEQRQSAFLEQSESMKAGTEALLERINDGLQTQLEASTSLVKQGKLLQAGIDESVKANLKASTSLASSSNELKAASQEMKVFGTQIKEAGNGLAVAVKNAVDSTSDLAQKNERIGDLLEKQREQLVEDQKLFLSATEKLQSLIQLADSSFDKMRDHQDQYLNALKTNVSELAEQMTDLLGEYASQANAQTSEHLGVWAKHTTNYAAQMNSATQALSSVVDEIEEKLGQ